MIPPRSTMPWFTKYVEGLVKSVNVFCQERKGDRQQHQQRQQRAKSASGAPHSPHTSPPRKPSMASSLLLSATRRSRKRPRRTLEVTSCTGRTIVGNESHLDSATRLAEEAILANYTEDDFRNPPTVAYPKAREGSLYSLLLVDLKGHNSLHARSHRLAWVQHNIPGAAFRRGDISSGTVCTPYRPPCCRRGSMNVLVLVFEQRHSCPLLEISPVFAEDCLRLSTWLSRFGVAARRMVVCEEFRAHVQRSHADATDSDACSSSSVELEMPTVSFHKLESPKRAKSAATAFMFSEQNGWVPVSAVSLSATAATACRSKTRPLDESPCASPKDCPKRIKVF